MGLFSKAKKTVKKVLKSDLGKLAAAWATYQYAPGMWGGDPGAAGWKTGWEKFAPWLMGTPETPGLNPQHPAYKAATGNVWQRMGTLGKAATVGTGIMAADKLDLLPKEKPDVPDIDDTTGHADYLRGRKGYLAEWAEWKADKEGISYEEALADLEANPMFSASQGGRVKAQGGLFAGQMPGRNPGMNPMNQMNQGLGAPNLGSRSMGMTPGMGTGGGQMDPRMAQMLQAQKLQGARRAGAVPRESEDTELIQLIKMLTSMGFPMEQLRGRTKEELVEMLVAASGKMGGEPDVKETADVIEEEEIRETEAAAGGGLMRTGYALGHQVIPSKDGMQLDMRDSGGYQPHGKAEKHDDVRALLAQGEFVMTSDAVKGMGGGDREMGAKKMYNLMHNMEAMA